MNNGEIELIKGSVLYNIKTIGRKRISEREKQIAVDMILEDVDLLINMYKYRKAVSTSDPMAKKLFKALSKIEMELFFYLAYTNNEEYNLSKLFSKLETLLDN